MNFLLLSLLFIMPKMGESANILVTAVSVAGSQNLVMYRLADLMGQRGHNVTMLKAEFFPEAKSIPLKHAKEISYSLIKDPEVSKKVGCQWDSNPLFCALGAQRTAIEYGRTDVVSKRQFAPADIESGEGFSNDSRRL